MLTPLSIIDMDAGIQCRAAIDESLTVENADKIREGAAFPSVYLYGSNGHCWIGDGWQVLVKSGVKVSFVYRTTRSVARE